MKFTPSFTNVSTYQASEVLEIKTTQIHFFLSFQQVQIRIQMGHTEVQQCNLIPPHKNSATFIDKAPFGLFPSINLRDSTITLIYVTHKLLSSHRQKYDKYD